MTAPHGGHVVAVEFCGHLWSPDPEGVGWHECTLPPIHDDPHRCPCGDTFTPAPPA